MIQLTDAEEIEYGQASRRVVSAMLGRYRDMQVAAAPVKSKRPGPLDPQPLPVEPRPSSPEPRYGKRDELLGKVMVLRHQRLNRKQIASHLEISLSFLGKILTEAGVKGDLGNDCQNCGKPTNRRQEAKFCRPCDPELHRKSAGRTKE